MKKLIISFVVIAAFVIFVVFLKTGTLNLNSNNSPTTEIVNTTPPTSSAPHETINPGTTTPPVIKTTGKYKDGTYTGPVTDAFYGPFQVSATIQGGKLTDVAFLQYPNDRGESVQINNRSNPKLKAEAIAAQSANVDIVSGATQSSQAFVQSLATALAQAKN